MTNGRFNDVKGDPIFEISAKAYEMHGKVHQLVKMQPYNRRGHKRSMEIIAYTFGTKEGMGSI